MKWSAPEKKGSLAGPRVDDDVITRMNRVLALFGFKKVYKAECRFDIVRP